MPERLAVLTSREHNAGMFKKRAQNIPRIFWGPHFVSWVHLSPPQKIQTVSEAAG